jgi:hypothetical protein
LCDVALNVIHVCMNAHCVCCCSLSGDRIERRLCGGGEVFEYQEEGDQGQANQGEPSTCCISESY